MVVVIVSMASEFITDLLNSYDRSFLLNFDLIACRDELSTSISSRGRVR
jgi:hypothetical protein